MSIEPDATSLDIAIAVLDHYKVLRRLAGSTNIRRVAADGKKTRLSLGRAISDECDAAISQLQTWLDAQ